MRLAQEGADIIALDACATPGWLSYPLATEADLAQTVKEVEALDRRIIARKADIRDLAARRGGARGGRSPSSAGGWTSWPPTRRSSPGRRTPGRSTSAEFRELIDVTLTGTFITVKAAVPIMIAGGQRRIDRADLLRRGDHGGQGARRLQGREGGVLALKDTLAYELAEHFIRVNAICPTAVDTPMIQNEALHRAFRPDLEHPGRDDVKAGFAEMNLLPIPWVDPVDVSNAIVWLASDAARYVTGVTLPVDAGNHLKC